MPYCPKCDMEFIDGITVCTDCGGPLAASEEEAKTLKEAEKANALAREKAMYDEIIKEFDENPDGTIEKAQQTISPPEHVKVYVDKSQKYDDLKSSASAFLIVGGVLLVVSILCWTGIVNIPMAPVSKMIFQCVITAMSIFSLFIYVSTSRSAKKMQPEIETEKNKTADIIRWFTDCYSAEDVDKAIENKDSLPDEELSLKRFQIIQDYLITGQDLPDQSYVDVLSEEIYTKLFES